MIIDIRFYANIWLVYARYIVFWKITGGIRCHLEILHSLLDNMLLII